MVKNRSLWKVCFITAVFLLAVTAIPKKARASFDFDNQLWMNLWLDAKVAKRFTIYFTDELRIGNDVSEAAYFHGEAGLKIQPHKLVTLGPYYRQVFAHLYNYWDFGDAKKKAWDAEFQPGWFVRVLLRPGRVVFSEALRFEVPIWENKGGAGFRMELQTLVGIKLPKADPRSVLPYLKNVSLFELHPDQTYASNRTAVGILFPVKGFIYLDLFYQWERSLREDIYYDFFVLGVAAHFRIDTTEEALPGIDSLEPRF